MNSAGFLSGKFLLRLVFVLRLGFVLDLGYVGTGFWVRLGRSLWLIGRSWSERHWAGGRANISQVIILVRGILVHGVMRGLLEALPCGCCGHGVGVSLLFLCSTCPRPPIARTRRSSINKFAHS